MSCIPASHSMTVLSQGDSQLEERPDQRRGSRAYQIFPEANLNEEFVSEELLYRRERLPSIVVEPTELSELGGGQLHWHQPCLVGNVTNDAEEEESESNHKTDTPQDGEQPEDVGIEESPAVRKSSIGPSQSQLSLSRLTPPASPTPQEAAPPCLRS